MRAKPSPRAASTEKAPANPSGRPPRPQLGARDLACILDSLSLPVFATDPANRFVFVNQAACRVLGQPREKLLGAVDTVLHTARPTHPGGSPEHVLLVNGCERVVSILRVPAQETPGGPPLTAGHLLDITDLRDTELACTLHQKRLEHLVRHLPLLVHAHDADGNFVFWNRECERVLGYTAEEVIGAPAIFARLYPDPGYRSQVRELHKAPGGFVDQELILCAADGAERRISWTLLPGAAPVPGWSGWAIGVDQTARKAAEAALRQAERRADALFQSAPMGVHLYRLEQNGTLILVAANPAADRILHRDNGRQLGQPIETAFPELTGTEAVERFRRACRLGEAWKTEQFDYHDDQISGTYEVHCFQTQPGSCACMFVDLTQQKRLETRLRHQALHDALTGIANRALCVERIDTALQRAKRRPDYRHAVIFLDLDRFQIINDTLGYSVGDAVLVETAQRLRGVVRELDTVARIGGDEFVVLMEEFDCYKRPIQAIKRIRKALEAPILTQGHEVTVTASIGLALGQTPADSAVEVLRNAHLAMHRAKSMGRSQVKSFTPSLLARTLNVVRLESDMDRALARGEFFLEFQPILQLGAGQQLFGFEALARWRHPERGLIMPAEFIPVAEDSGKVVELGYWALREGSRILNQWRGRHPHLRDAMLSVNLSPQQVPKADFLPRMRDILEETGLPARNLKLEVTETALMQSGATVLNKLEELRDMGVTFSVDDFGTGYSSLAYLTRLPLDHLKIDLSFVRMLESGRQSLEIVRTIIQLATSLRLDVVAEGVETLNQQKILQGLGCEYFQGYLFARPLPEAEAEEFLRRFKMVLPPASGTGLDNLP